MATALCPISPARSAMASPLRAASATLAPAAAKARAAAAPMPLLAPVMRTDLPVTVLPVALMTPPVLALWREPRRAGRRVPDASCLTGRARAQTVRRKGLPRGHRDVPSFRHVRHAPRALVGGGARRYHGRRCLAELAGAALGSGLRGQRHARARGESPRRPRYPPVAD